jgi:hypothetical protein
MPAQVGGLRHHPAQRVDLLDQMALADAADGRVAAHRADGLDVVGQQQRARTGARGRQRGLGAGVAAADDDDVEVVEATRPSAPASGARRGAKRRFANAAHSPGMAAADHDDIEGME